VNSVADVVAELQSSIDAMLDLKRELVAGDSASASELEYIEGCVCGYMNAIILLDALLKGASNE
jgi:hypothetical protein